MTADVTITIPSWLLDAITVALSAFLLVMWLLAALSDRPAPGGGS